MTPAPLAGILAKRRAAMEEDRREFPPGSTGRDTWPPAGASLRDALRRPAGAPPRVLAEVKLASPSAGAITTRAPADLARAFRDAGAAALSVLVDRANFAGRPAHLRECRAACPGLPVLYKDFVTEPWQVELARHLGASSVLLMTQILDDDRLDRLYRLALDCGLEPFVEVHGAGELERALARRPPVVGVNARDFATPGLPVDLQTAPRLLAGLAAAGRAWPADTVLVCQSGLEGPADLRRLLAACPAGLPDAVQVGTSLSRDGGAWLRELGPG